MSKLVNGLIRGYFSDMKKEIRREEKYISCKGRIDDMRSEGRKPYRSDLEYVKEYEYVDNSPPAFLQKEYWIGEIGGYYWDQATNYLKERW